MRVTHLLLLAGLVLAASSDPASHAGSSAPRSPSLTALEPPLRRLTRRGRGGGGGGGRGHSHSDKKETQDGPDRLILPLDPVGLAGLEHSSAYDSCWRSCAAGGRSKGACAKQCR